jgi:SAM-dependent methyltransferase
MTSDPDPDATPWSSPSDLGFDLRERARLFDGEAERYDRSRPDYPAALIDAVLGPAPAGLSVLDVACGTGIASRMMADRGARVLGIDLNAGMAAVAAQHGIATEVAPFDAWDPAGRTFDRVTCAQAWHWLDPHASARKAASLLHPDGRLCLWWNIGHHPDDVADALAVAYRNVLPPGSRLPIIGYGAYRSDQSTLDYTMVTDALAACAALAPPQLQTFPWTRTYTRDEWLDELLSHSDHTALAPDLQEAVLAAVGATIDEFGGSFDMTFTTTLVTTSLA